MFHLGHKLTLKRSQLWLARLFLINFSNLSQNSSIFRNLNHYQRHKMEIFQATMFILSWQFTVFQYKFDWSQVKWDMIASILDFVSELPHEFTNNLKLRILGD